MPYSFGDALQLHIFYTSCGGVVTLKLKTLNFLSQAEWRQLFIVIPLLKG